jgi:3-phosphoshikimate 1-carboxyvinyltransferase
MMLGALANGTSQFPNFLEADDCLRTLKAFQAMGVNAKVENGKLSVEGVGLRGLKAPKDELDLGNSGTSMRLLLGVLAGQAFEAKLIGDESLTKRPMKRVVEPLQKMGATIWGREDGSFAPLTIKGSKLHSIEWTNEIASAQVKSAVLLAGLFGDGLTIVHEPRPTRDHTERLIEMFGGPIEQTQWRTTVRHAQELKAIEFPIPGDFSSAAFFIAAALLVPGSDLRIENVGLNPTRIGFYTVLKHMGAKLEIEKIDDRPEPSGTLRVHSSELKGIQVDPQVVPLLIDELPILMVLCALAKGKSVIRGARELRVKETDRIRSMGEGIRTIGGKFEEREDGCVIEGVTQFKGGAISSFADHRTAMSLAIAGLRAEGGVKVQGSECVDISYPKFEKDLQAVLS